MFFFRFATSLSQAEEWKKLKGDHFIIHYVDNEKYAKEILWNAEKYYDRVADDLGYPRYAKFWQWENRVKIYIYPDKDSYIESGDHPAWSYGMADYDEKAINTYVKSERFTHSILPHEITHLIFRDYVGFTGKIPMWLDEGVAQWQEPDKRENIERAIQYIYKKEEVIPLDRFMELDIRLERDENIVRSYYIQAMSLIDFLIKKYGSDRFIYFCRSLRNGKSVEGSLRSTFPTEMRTLGDFEREWMRYIRELD